MATLEFQGLAKGEPIERLADARDDVPMLDRVVESPQTWMRDTVDADQWTVNLPEAAWSEIERMVDEMRVNPLPTLLYRPSQFHLHACQEVMARVRHILTEGMGLAVLDRLPMDELSQDEASAVTWVLGQSLAPPVATKWDGTMLYDVTDTGKRFGYGVRGSWTNVELAFHTDNAFGIALPDYVSLLCIRPAREGGVSQFCSLYTVHNEMLRHYPRLLARLYQPVYFDRQAEHAPGEPKVSWAPPFSYDGRRLTARLSVGLARRGYEMVGEAMDAELVEAFGALQAIMNNPALWVSFTIQRGQIQYLNNKECAHFRSTFQDDDDPELKRHLVRTWYRNEGRSVYNG